MHRTARVFFAILLGLVVAMPAMAYAQKLQKKISRRFPEMWCPIEMDEADKWSSTTGIAELVLEFTQGPNTLPLDLRLDDIAIIEVGEFTAKKQTHPICAGFDFNLADLLGNPLVPFYEPFDPVASACPWDVGAGAAVLSGELRFVDPGAGVSRTSVVVSGLDPAKEYVLWCRWHAQNFNETVACTDALALCLEVIVNEISTGCPLPIEEGTWGKIKALYSE